MSDHSGKPHYDDPQSEEDEAIAESGHGLVYRRMAASSGRPKKTEPCGENFTHAPQPVGDRANC